MKARGVNAVCQSQGLSVSQTVSQSKSVCPSKQAVQKDDNCPREHASPLLLSQFQEVWNPNFEIRTIVWLRFRL